MRAIVSKTGLLLVASLIVLGAAAWAEERDKALYTWTDNKGVMHMTDSLEKVPEKYRSQARRIEGGTPGGNVVPETQSPAAPAAPDQAVEGGSLKAQWQSRMLDAKRKLQQAEDRYQQLAKRKNDLQSQWGSSGPALPPQTVLDEMNQLDTDMAAAKQDADKARDLIDNVIPDEARRAGIPPGWLREVE